MAMREIAEFYKYGYSKQPNQGSVSDARERRAPQLPHLKRLHVWSDGQRSQYKGEIFLAGWLFGQSRSQLVGWSLSYITIPTSPTMRVARR